MNTINLLQQALDELAVAAAKLNESAIRLRCAFSDEDRKGKQKAGCASFGAHSLDMQFAASSGIGNPKRDSYNDCEQAAQLAQVARADLGKELDPLREVSNEEVRLVLQQAASLGGFTYALNAFLARRRAP